MKKIKLKIQQKIQFFIIAATIIIYIAAIGYISLQARKMAFSDATKVTNKQVEATANEIEKQLTANLEVVSTLAHAMQNYAQLPEEEWKALYNKMYRDVMENNHQIYSLWDSWELSAIDPEWDKPYGRYTNTFWRENGQILHKVEMRSLEGDPPLYAAIKKKTTSALWEPYQDVFAEGKSEAFMMTTVNTPMIVNGQYIGLIAMDITLEQFQELMSTIKPFKGSYASLISNQGVVVAHPNSEVINTNITDFMPKAAAAHNLNTRIKKGESFQFSHADNHEEEYFYTFAPVELEGINTPWSVAIAVPVDTIMQEANTNFRISLLVGLLGLIIMSIVIHYIGKSITQPITLLTSLFKKMASGNIDDSMKVQIETGDEIEEMTHALNQSIDGLNEKTRFAKAIEQGNLTYDFQRLSENDQLGEALLEMRKSLQDANQEHEQRIQEDEKRRWANEGLALFADILRQNNDDLNELAFQIIQNLVNYLKANQGGLFILSEDEEQTQFELLSAFAFDRRKYLTSTVQLGEGLVGTCAIEKKTIYMTELPDDYIKITSGLGGANPNSLLIVPLKLEEQVLGVIEMASFKSFEKYEIEFVEKVAESIASTLNSVRINIRTNQLLERSQQQAEEMAAQEEEMRQNMEELQATQEESARKSAEMEGLIEALNLSTYVVEYDLDGYIQNINANMLKLLGLAAEEVVGTHHNSQLQLDDQQKADYEQFWQDLRNGQIRRQETTMVVKGKEFVFSETYTPIRDADGDVVKILKIANNITEFKK
ncbi:MAG: GAF domain-containing protein [Bacteroidota bacterium]